MVSITWEGERTVVTIRSTFSVYLWMLNTSVSPVSSVP